MPVMLNYGSGANQLKTSKIRGSVSSFALVRGNSASNGTAASADLPAAQHGSNVSFVSHIQ